MLLHPVEAKLLKQSRQLSTIIKVTGRGRCGQPDGGWVGLTIRG